MTITYKRILSKDNETDENHPNWKFQYIAVLNNRPTKIQARMLKSEYCYKQIQLYISASKIDLKLNMSL